MSGLLCKHDYKLTEQNGYEVCKLCGTYHSLAAKPPLELYTADYWSADRGHSTIAEQVHNVNVHTENGVTKNDFVLGLLDGRRRGAALEIGCAPGVLLKRLEGIGFSPLIGVEANAAFGPAIREQCGQSPSLMFGLFPEITQSLEVGAMGLVVAMDVLEHSFEPEAFLLECGRLLKHRGQLLLMVPLVDDGLPDRFFNPIEHVYLYSRDYLTRILAYAGFDRITFNKWTEGHDTVRCEMSLL